MKQKYQIGQMVEAGQIVRAFHPELFLEYAAYCDNVDIEVKKESLKKSWGEEWNNAPVYGILLIIPTRQISYEDWLFTIKNIQWYKPEFYKEIYESVTPIRKILDMPEHLVAAQVLEDGGFDLTKVEKTDE